MPLLRSQLDTSGILVSRPTEFNAGGKRVYRIVYSKLRAAITETSELVQDPETRADQAKDVVIFRIPFRDFRGQEVHIDRNDAIAYVDYRGQDKQLIVMSVRAVKNAMGSRVDHLRVQAEG